MTSGDRCLQLDGARFGAAALVMAQHWIVNPAGLPLPAGLLGITAFFVLSGYLITRLLLQARDRADGGARSRVGELSTFVARRSLRIFPLYFTVAAVLIAFDAGPARESAAWLLTYTLNWKFAAIGGYEEVISHFWTLAVEEQFYLAFPLLMLWTPRRALHLLPWAFIVVAVASRALGDAAGFSDRSIGFTTPACLDSLGCGAGLAMLQERRPAAFARLADGRVLALLLGALALMTAAWLRWGDDGSHRIVWLRLLLALPCAWLVARAAQERRGALGALLAFRPFVALGGISYGLYVFHDLADDAFRAAGIGTLPALARVPLLFAATVAASAVSWIVLERPMNALKRFVPAEPGGRRASRDEAEAAWAGGGPAR